MPELPQAHVCHLTPRRIRLRIPERRHDAAFFEKVKDRLSNWDSVEQVEVNPLTASVLVHYSDSTALFVENAGSNDIFALAPVDADSLAQAPPADGEPLAESARRGAGNLDRALRQFSGGQGDLRSVIMLALVGTGIIQLLRGNVAAPAVTLFWYAGDVLRLWNGDGYRTSASGSGERT